jgi:hypothetical protein
METKQLVKAITFRLSEEVIRALQRMAATQSRSVNKQAEAILKYATREFKDE